jgi:non-specific serine/threonine protein kinase
MEYIEGKSLRDVINEYKLGLDKIIDIIRQLSEGLSKAHKAGIVHRDIKPENIIIGKDARVRILDFGLAKLKGVSKLTKVTSTLGTIHYMSPEQIQGQDIDCRSDIWSLGVVLFELLTGDLPFKGQYESAVIYAILNEDPCIIRELRSDCSDSLSKIVRNCLQKNPQDRFQSIQDILDAFEDGSYTVTAKKDKAEKHNLPTQLTSFIGREKEIDTIKDLLNEHRLVTLTGPGGCGKTRLAIASVSERISKYKDGVWFINLAPIADSNFVALEISKTLGIKEQPNKEIIDTLIEYIRNMSLLILLDNCEHLVQTCAELANRLLQSVKGLKILTTSREALNIPAEMVLRTPSLSFPDRDSNIDVNKVDRYEAVKLFVERAKTCKFDFDLNPQNVLSVIKICQRLAGIPLAIELAATRIRHMGPETILRHLEDQVKILASSSRTAPERQQTLKATIDWSYNLLQEQEQLLFNRLSVFAGGFDHEAVENVCTDEKLKKENIFPMLCQLVDKSLVIAEDQEEGFDRYRFLVPILQYSLQKLSDSGEETNYRDCHLSYYLNLAEQAYQQQFESQLKWLNKLEQEHDNLIAALNWAHEKSNEKFITLSGYLGWFWYLHGHSLLGMDYLERAVSESTDKSESYAHVITRLGMFIHLLGDSERTINLLHESLNIWRQFKNYREEAIVLGLLGKYASYSKDHEKGLKYNEKSLEIARKIDDPGLLNNCLADLCQCYIGLRKFEQAKPFVEELVVSSEKLQQPWEIVLSHHFRGDCSLGTRNFNAAEKEYGLAVTSAVKYGNTLYVALDLHGVAYSVSGQSRWAKAVRLDAAARNIYKQLGIEIYGVAEFWDEFIDTYIEGAKKHLGEKLSQKYEEEGKKMELEAAVEYALDFDKD